MFKMSDYHGSRAKADEHYSMSRFGELWYHIFVGPECNGICPVYMFW